MADIFAPAKVNLFLDVIARRDDGYHELKTAFLAVDLCDMIRVEEGEAGFFVEGPFADSAPATEENLVYTALRELEAEAGRGFPPLSIHLVKNIPVFAGLGGGSSDAAAMIRLLDKMFVLGLGEERLMRVAARVGSDCAFFIRPGVAMARGRGEVLSPLLERDFAILILLPAFTVSTREAYASLRPEMLGERSDAEGLVRWLEGGALEARLYNTFEAGLAERYPELAEMRLWLERQGAVLARLSGSGSATFGVFTDKEKRDRACRNVPGGWRGFACGTYGGSA